MLNSLASEARVASPLSEARAREVMAPVSAFRNSGPCVCRGVPLYVPGAYATRPDWPAMRCENVIEPSGEDTQAWGRGATTCDGCAAELDRRTTVQANDDAEADLRKRLERAGLPVPFVTGAKSIETFKTPSAGHREALAACMERVDTLVTRPYDASRNVFLYGPAGVGKTHLQQAIVREVIRAGRPAVYVNARDLALSLQSASRDGAAESPESIMARLSKPHLIVLDDLGATKASRFQADNIYTLLDRRCQSALPTIISSNYPLKELGARLLAPDSDALDGMRQIDRIRELCPRMFELTGKSQRGEVNR